MWPCRPVGRPGAMCGHVAVSGPAWRAMCGRVAPSAAPARLLHLEERCGHLAMCSGLPLDSHGCTTLRSIGPRAPRSRCVPCVHRWCAGTVVHRRGSTPHALCPHRQPRGMRRRSRELPRVFRGSDAVGSGLVSLKQLRGPGVQRLLPGVYAPAGVRRTHRLRSEAAGLLLPRGAMLTGASLATVRGCPLLATDDDVEVVLPESAYRCRVRGVRQRRVVVPLEAPSGRCGTTPTAGPARMALDLVLGLRLDDAVERLDAVAHAGLVDLDAVEQALAVHRERGVVAAREAVAWADGGAASPPETRLRLLLRRAGVPVTPQVVVRTTAGAFVARVDLGVDGTRVAVEYDGAWHGHPQQLARDRARLNALNDAGWTVVHVTAEMLSDPASVVAAVRRAVRRTASTR